MEKKTIRKSILHQLSQMSQPEYDLLSNKIHNQLLHEPEVTDANTIGITISHFPEVETYSLIEAFWQEGKRVVVPKCHPKDRSMIFYEITSFDQLETVYLHLKEPITSMTKPIHPEDIDLLLVPGVVFDYSGYRVGFGGGYYDRYLPHFKGSTIALAFDVQVVEEVPVDDHDIPVDLIITDSKRICSRSIRKEKMNTNEIDL